MSGTLKSLMAAGLLALSLSVSASGIGQLSDFLKNTHSASGKFTQRVSDRQGGQAARPMSGTFRFSRPGKFFWGYESPYKQEIYCNGKTLSVWDPDLMQVTVRSVAAGMPASPASVLFGNNDFSKDFTVKEDGAEQGIEWIMAVPKNSDAGFERIRIGFRNSLPAEMELKDAFGQTISLQMTGVVRNKSFPAEKFEFVPPKGVEVLRQ